MIALRLLLISVWVSLVTANVSIAQTMSLDLGDGPSATARIVQLIALITVLSVAPGILVTITSFTRIVVVFSFLRNALGVQQTPPNMVIVSLALFLTGFVMAPTFERAYEDGIVPLMAEDIDEMEAFDRTIAPFRDFMLMHVREADLRLFMDMARSGSVAGPEDVPLSTLVPAFMISELRRAFEIGFLIFVPFIIIDMVVASVLMAMGMMMLPPIFISLPFKLIFFVLVDGWLLLSGSLVRSYDVLPTAG